MKLKYLQKPTEEWNKRIPKSKEFPRHWITIVDIEVELSDKYVLKIPKGTIWDGASIPTWLWWLFKPIDEGALGDLIHDVLWTRKLQQLVHFGLSIFKARKFADDERLKWRTFLVPMKKIKNCVTHKVIRWIGGFFYSRQLEIPN
jgi:hypothetical protein